MLAVMDNVTIATYDNPMDANIAKARLEADGIECVLLGDKISSIIPTGAFDIRLTVAEENAEAAQEILQDME